MNRRGFKGIFILLLLGLFFSPAQEAAARDRSILEVGLRPGVSFADEVGLGTVQGLATLHYLPAWLYRSDFGVTLGVGYMRGMVPEHRRSCDHANPRHPHHAFGALSMQNALRFTVGPVWRITTDTMAPSRYMALEVEVPFLMLHGNTLSMWDEQEDPECEPERGCCGNWIPVRRIGQGYGVGVRASLRFLGLTRWNRLNVGIGVGFDAILNYQLQGRTGKRLLTPQPVALGGLFLDVSWSLVKKIAVREIIF